ncbi:hypothetical protein [Nocardioides zeae]|uniref:Uncharacterized protein n=1 Tax=Nocardioides zeae TaxID=1457234 RepID=A0AAJ1U4X7_9ACTN|nr:hypothetical protein [Nocardioides zeae]MDQ1105573.1 hypothetical protein [Nocardioides zeae]
MKSTVKSTVKNTPKSTLKNTARIAMAALAATASLGVAGATTSPAQAGAACDASWAANYAACGGAANHVSGIAFRITTQWPSSATYLSPSASVGNQVVVGGGSTLGGPGGGGTDVDGYLIRERCQGQISIGANGTRTWQGPGWRKISDGQVVHLWAHRCEA